MPASAFALEDLRHEDGLVIVQGQWSGVRGMRFMRPSLSARGRRVLATLEHKPWAPDGEGPWTAAFPWDDAPLDPAEARIDVAPSVTVALAGGAAGAPLEPEPDPVELERERFARRATEVDYLRDALRRTEGERDRALARCEEAIRDREAAVRTRGRMEAQRAEAMEALAGERRAREAADARAREAQARADETRRARDELLVAYQSLEERLRVASAAAARAATPERAADEEQPLGVRTIPAVKGELADLAAGHRAPRLTELDLWAFRVLGGVAAVCFLLLLISLLLVFI